MGGGGSIHQYTDHCTVVPSASGGEYRTEGAGRQTRYIARRHTTDSHTQNTVTVNDNAGLQVERPPISRDRAR
eukprot:7187822-Prymnesium_polylepis.1